MSDTSMYTGNEIKYKIDTAIQLSMFETEQKDWDKIMDVQRRLYEQFGIVE